MVKKDFISRANKRIKRLEFWDLQLIKLSSMGFVLMIAKLWEPILGLEWYRYAIICILAALVPLNKVYNNN